MQKVYLVETDTGSYDDARNWVDSIWDDPKLAEDRKLQIDTEYKEKRERENPIGHEDYNIMSESEYEIYKKWTTDKSDAYEYNFSTVTEIEVNKKIK